MMVGGKSTTLRSVPGLRRCLTFVATEVGEKHSRHMQLSERLSQQPQRMFVNEISKNGLHQRCR